LAAGCTQRFRQAAFAGCYKRQMKYWYAIRRLLSVSWLAAAPLVILVLILVLFLLLQLIAWLVGLVFGHEAAEALVVNVFLLMGMLFWPALLGVPNYALLCEVKTKVIGESRQRDRLNP
jgi:hypothetical protein